MTNRKCKFRGKRKYEDGDSAETLQHMEGNVDYEDYIREDISGYIEGDLINSKDGRTYIGNINVVDDEQSETSNVNVNIVEVEPDSIQLIMDL
jgi:hypothetical protein